MAQRMESVGQLRGLVCVTTPSAQPKWHKQIIAEQPAQRQQQFTAAFAKLTDQVDRTLATKNRDRFTKQLYNAVRLIKS